MISSHCGNLFGSVTGISQWPAVHVDVLTCFDMLHFDIPDSGLCLHSHRHWQAMFQKTVPKGETIIKCAKSLSCRLECQLIADSETGRLMKWS